MACQRNNASNRYDHDSVSMLAQPELRPPKFAGPGFGRAKLLLSRGGLCRLGRSLALARCKVGVDWVEKPTAKGALLLRTCGRWRLPFPPL